MSPTEVNQTRKSREISDRLEVLVSFRLRLQNRFIKYVNKKERK